MKVLAIIPARMASTRFPGKPLAQINGKPMIQWVYESAQKAYSIDELIVATDHPEIAKIVHDFGGEAMMTSENHPSGLDRVCEVMQKKSNFTHYLNIQGDEPLISTATIDGVMSMFSKNSECQISTAAVPFSDEKSLQDSNQVKAVFDKNYRALYFSRAVIPFARNRNYNPADYFKHQGIYAYTKETLLLVQNLPQCITEKTESLEQLRFLHYGFGIYIHIAKVDSIGVDHPEDITRVESFLRSQRP